MSTTDYRKPVRLEEVPVTPTSMPRMSRASVKALRVSLPDIGVVCIATMSLRLSYRVFEHLMAMCDDSRPALLVRGRLMNDESLHLGDKEWSWFWIVLELLSADVVDVKCGMLVKKDEEYHNALAMICSEVQNG